MNNNDFLESKPGKGRGKKDRSKGPFEPKKTPAPKAFKCGGKIKKKGK